MGSSGSDGFVSTGLVGIVGTTGFVGSSVTGADGFVGSSVVTGADGFVSTGFDGSVGLTGSNGLVSTGFVGLTGSTGFSFTTTAETTLRGSVKPAGCFGSSTRLCSLGTKASIAFKCSSFAEANRFNISSTLA